MVDFLQAGEKPIELLVCQAEVVESVNVTPIIGTIINYGTTEGSVAGPVHGEVDGDCTVIPLNSSNGEPISAVSFYGSAAPYLDGIKFTLGS